MKLAELLDERRSALLLRRLRARLPNAPASGLLSITLDLGAADDEDWLDVDLARTHSNWWAGALDDDGPAFPGAPIDAGQCSAARTDYRLGVGCAMSVSSAGPARFLALQAAFAGLTPVWEHDDWQHTDFVPEAHIGFAFDEESADDLPNARLLVPAVLLANRAGCLSATFSCAVRTGEGAIKHWQSLLRALTPGAAVSLASSVQRRREALTEQAFLARVRAALAEIDGGGVDKLVLARSAHFDGRTPIALPPLLAALTDRHPACTIFAVGGNGHCFLGATPERLVSLRDGRVEADALAGTSWLAAAPMAGKASTPALRDDKNLREQQLVVDAVRAALLPLCAALTAPEPAEVMQLRGLQHLRTRVRGRARSGTGLFDLIACLHPTPAVAGAPVGAARLWLRSHGDRRGSWYSGGIGWIDRDGDGEAVVALRCARVTGSSAELFAGAGIVAGSDPAQELAETEAKMALIAEALRQPLPLARARTRRSA